MKEDLLGRAECVLVVLVNSLPRPHKTVPGSALPGDFQPWEAAAALLQGWGVGTGAPGFKAGRFGWSWTL